MLCYSLSCFRLFRTTWNVIHQSPPSMEFSKQEYWSELPFPSGDRPDLGIEPRSLTMQADSLPSEPPGKPRCRYLAEIYLSVLVAQSCPTLDDSIDCSPLGSSVHEMLQARILEWVAIPFARGSSLPSEPDLPYFKQILYHMSHQGSPIFFKNIHK